MEKQLETFDPLFTEASVETHGSTENCASNEFLVSFCKQEQQTICPYETAQRTNS